MNKPIYEIDCHEKKKIFSLSWYDKDKFLSGGEDGSINLHELIN